MYVCMYVYMYVCMYVCTYMYLFMYVCNFLCMYERVNKLIKAHLELRSLLNKRPGLGIS